MPEANFEMISLLSFGRPFGAFRTEQKRKHTIGTAVVVFLFRHTSMNISFATTEGKSFRCA